MIKLNTLKNEKVLIIIFIIIGFILGGLAYFVNDLIFLLIASLFGLFIFFKTIKYPELWLAVFSLAYFFKGGITSNRIDLTLVTLILAIISVSYYIILKISKKTYRNNIKIIDIIILLFSLWVGINWALSMNVMSIEKYLRFLTLVLVPYILVRLSIQSKDQVKRFLLYFSIGNILIAIISLMKINFINQRLQIYEINQIPLATSMAITAIILTMFLFHKELLPFKIKKNLLNVFLTTSILLVLLILILTQTRGVIISLILSIIISIFIIRIISNQRIIKNKYKYYMILSILIILIIMPFCGLNILKHSRFTSVLSGKDPSINARIDSIYQSIGDFAENPIFGKGIEKAYPHNIFLDILIEEGIIGIVIFILFLIYYFKMSLSYLHKTKQNYHLFYFIFIITIMLLIEAQFSFRLDGHKWLFMFIALNINLINKNENTTNN